MDHAPGYRHADNLLDPSACWRDKNFDMIHCWRAFSALLALALSVGFAGAQPAAKGVADYQIGDTALSNINATVELVVLDREASAVLREQTSAKVPVVFRLQPDAGETAVRRLREQFAITRDTFVLQLAAQFGRRQLDPATIKSAAFREFRTSFQAENKGLPVTARLGADWAAGGDGAAIEQELTAALREAVADRRIRADELAEAVRLGPNQVRLLPADTAPVLASGAIERTGTVVNRAALTPLNKVRTEVQKQFTAGDRGLGRFLAGLIEADCVFDAVATKTLRDFKTSDLWTAERYAAGQEIVRAGEPVTPKIKAALDELASQTAVTGMRQQPWRSFSYWPLVLISVSTGLIIAGAFVFFISRRIEPRLDTLIVETGGATALLPPDRLAPPPESGGLAHAGATPAITHEQVERVLHDRLVNTLLSQRKQMVDVQRQAVSDIAGLELRLTQLQAPLQARLDAYEQRIAELEKDLVTRGHENSELINATIALVKEKLETERGHQQPRVKLN